AGGAPWSARPARAGGGGGGGGGGAGARGGPGAPPAGRAGARPRLGHRGGCADERGAERHAKETSQTAHDPGEVVPETAHRVQQRSSGTVSRMGSRTVALAVLVVVLLAAPCAGAATVPPPTCGGTSAQPMYVEFSDGSVGFRDDVFRHAGLVLGSAGTKIPQTLRDGGAATFYWEMNLDVWVGTPSDPEDPESIEGSAETLYDRAVASTGCSTPW